MLLIQNKFIDWPQSWNGGLIFEKRNHASQWISTLRHWFQAIFPTWFPTLTVALWVKCTYQRLHIAFLSLHFRASLSDLCLSIFRRHFCTDSVESAFCVRGKFAAWCKALTSSLSRQPRSMRCRKQSSACLLSTSPDMAWPLHRSPFYTIGFLLERRVCMGSVCSLCLRICLN